jgi:lysophospholipase-like protein
MNNIGKTIVFVNGSSFGKWCWEENFCKFFKSKNINTVTFDFSGHEKSYDKKKINSMSLDDYSKELINQLKKIEDEIIIVAHSVGCSIVLSEMDSILNYTNKIIFLTPVGNRSMLFDYFKFIFNFLRKRNIARLYFDDRIDSDKYDEYKSYLVPVSKKVSFELLKHRKIKRINKYINILIIASNNDLTIRDSSILKLGKELRAKVIFISDLCHAIMLDNKWESVAHEILEHIVK